MESLRKERMRNLTFHILKYVIENPSFNIDEEITNEDLKTKFYFKQSDVLNYSNEFLNNSRLKDNIKSTLDEYLALHQRYKGEINESQVEDFKSIYKKLVDYYANINKNEDLQLLLHDGALLAEKIHWISLPIFKEVYMSNAGMLPEENLEEYYFHFHTIEDLYREITNDVKKVHWKSVQGDINLNKKMKMKIYTNRWGRHDYYTVQRTIEGWIISFLTFQNVKCKVNGESLDTDTGFYEILRHDSVQYPKDGVRYALETLWEEADSTEMSKEVLEKKLNEIAVWISEVEKATHKYQPSWCGYY
ncbi:hypothetical protein JMA_26750 [Jeotgalibacillus malaysiensis]|uniref:Integron cassette protein domain-containing protein n=1 Tax=Jeotgalibacillus malaysiensis TaxID=1508404 RepID=A0A0B5ATE6_9BACL|nr:hypothetical protein [Jeotgalibacillus malaysiensis]AJD91992.1 hypothetical protein JMA_26750 [Jeotgalibacillus malaysiensis]